MSRPMQRIDPKIKKKLVPLISKRVQLSKLAKDSKEELEEVNGKIEAILIQAKVNKCEVLDYAVSRSNGTNVSLAVKIEQLPALLMQYVNDADKAAELAEKLVKRTEYTYVRVDGIKKEALNEGEML